MLTLAEAARECELNPATLRHAVKVGHLKARKYGKMWFVTRRDLKVWLDNPKVHKAKKGTKTNVRHSS